MALEHARWWHWFVISLLVGWVLYYANSTPVEPLNRYDFEQVEFEHAIGHAPAASGQIPWVKNLLVYPSTIAHDSKGNELHVMPVLFDVLGHKPGGSDDEFQYQPTWYCAPIPYTPMGFHPILDANDPLRQKLSGKLPPGIERTFVPTADQNISTITQSVYGTDTGSGEEAIRTCNSRLFRISPSVQKLIDHGMYRLGQPILIPPDPNKSQATVRDWLTAAAGQYPWVQFQYAWWKDPKYCQWLWMGSTILIIGVLWPISLYFLAKAGLGGRALAEQHYDLKRFGTGKPKPAVAAKPKSKELSQAGAEQLAAMNRSLMTELEQVATSGGGKAAPAPSASPATAAKSFVPGAAEPAAQPVVKPQEDEKEFAGEFYPVAQPKEKGKEEEKKA